MDIKRIEGITIRDLYNIIPEKMMFWIEQWDSSVDKYIVYSAFDDKAAPLGMALFLTYKVDTKVVALTYYVIKEEYRGHGFGKALLEEAIKDLRKMGYLRILAETSPNADEAVTKILKSCGYKEVERSVNVGYKIGDLRKAGLAARMANEGVFRKIRRYEELNESEIKKFRKEYLTRNFSLQMNELNYEYTRFYEEDGEIRGWLAVEAEGEDIAYSIGYYVKEGKNSGLIMAILVFSVVEAVVEKLGDEAGLMLEFAGMENVAAMKKSFGEPVDTAEMVTWML